MIIIKGTFIKVISEDVNEKIYFCFACNYDFGHKSFSLRP